MWYFLCGGIRKSVKKYTCYTWIYGAKKVYAIYVVYTSGLYQHHFSTHKYYTTFQPFRPSRAAPCWYGGQRGAPRPSSPASQCMARRSGAPPMAVRSWSRQSTCIWCDKSLVLTFDVQYFFLPYACALTTPAPSGHRRRA